MSTSGVPTGSVEFYDGSTPLGAGSPLTGSLNSATSAFTISTLSVSGSPHEINAEYTATGSCASSNGTNLGQTITAAALTVTPNAVSTTYSGVALNNTTYSDTTGNYSITGFQNGQTISSAGVTLSGSMAFNGSTLTSVENAGTYTQEVGTRALSRTNSNYSMTFSNLAPNNYVIRAKTLTITANNASKVYGSANPTFTATYSGLVSGESPTNLGGTLTFTTSAVTTSPVGTYAVTPGGLTSTNYAITFVPATLTITLSVSTSSASIYVLDPTAGGALTMSGNADINIGGSLVVDSNSSSAISSSGNAQVTATSGVLVVGGVSKTGNAKLTKTGTPGATGDPLAGIAYPTASYTGTPISESLSSNSSGSISPGLYSQISVSGNATLQLASGTYVVQGGGVNLSGNASVSCPGVTFIVAGGGFSVSGNATITGAGVTIFNAGSGYNASTGLDGGTFGAITLSGNASVSAPSSGPYAGILIFQARDNSRAMAFSGNAMQGITGTIYAKIAQVAESGNAQVGSTSNPISMVADTMTLSGNAIANSVSLSAPAGTVAYTPAQIRAAYGINALGAGLPTPPWTGLGAGLPTPPSARPKVSSRHHDLPRFLGIFEQVCQTMAYAHARGVIHRDLKPSNVMVGSFGEVQVMDWGLAKVLLQGGIVDEAAAHPLEVTVITTVRSGSPRSGIESQAGSVLGTPSYMAPEQARGEMDRIDERADVFGLRATLCEILTGRPPFAGSTREEIRAQAARGELTDALARLEASGVDGDLIGLARDCLAAELDRRPRNAGEVARRVTAYRAGAQERLKAAELAWVEAQTRAEEETKRRAVADELVREARARAEEERKRRRMTVALAASALVTLGLVSGGWAYLEKQRQERSARVMLALGEVEVLRTEAERAGDDLARWLTARDAAQAVERLLADAPDKSTRMRATEVVRDVTQAAAAAENDQKLLARLVDSRGAKADDPDGSVSDAAYEDAFREAGIDIAALPPAESGPKIRARPPAVRVALAAALDDWAAVRRGPRVDHAGALRLTEAARLADPDPWRNRLRELLQTAASPERLSNLKDLAKSARMQELPAVSLHLLGAALLNMGDPTAAEAVLREGQRLYVGDVWLNLTLAQCLKRLARREEAIRYFMAARSLRPETAHLLAHALEAKGETDQAIAIFQDLARQRPKEGIHLLCLGVALKSRGRAEEAKAVLDAAIAATRAAIRLKPALPGAHTNLGSALADQGKLNEAIAAYREALRLKPDYADAHNNLGLALTKQGKLSEAIIECREALRHKPDYSEARYNLANALKEQGNMAEAIAAYREALRLKPDYADAHNDLGVALADQGKLEEAIAKFREALRHKPDHVNAHNNLGNALCV